MRHSAQLMVVAGLAVAYQSPASSDAGAETSSAQVQEPSGNTDATPSPSDPELKTGIMLRSVEERAWGLRLNFPLSVGLTEFDLASGVSLDDVATVSVVPTAEFIIPLDNKWTLLPFVGAGGAAAVGDHEAVSGESALGLVSGGLRAQRWQPFAELHVIVFATKIRYDAALTRRNGLLGDWGSLTGAVELRRTFGARRDGPRFQPGVYAQGFWFWDPVELEIPGVTPSFLDNQREFGISLGSSTPHSIWGITLPRLFIGVRLGEGVRSLRIRFGRL